MAIPVEDENSNEKVRPPLQPTAPDLIPHKDGIRRPSTENRSNQNLERRSSTAKVETSRESRESRPWTWRRRMCCLGWIFCFPVCCACYALRERPVDEEDMREDDCLPCYD